MDGGRIVFLGRAALMHKLLLVAITIGMLLAVPAAAQAPPASEGTQTRIRGTIEKFDGETLTVQSREGPQVTIGLAPNFTVVGVARRSLGDIKAGDYVASTSVKGTDGNLHALEVHIFPEAMRGTGEGQRPHDLVPNSLMTNATVSGVTAAPQGQMLKVTYKGGEAEVIVGPDTPIVTYVPGDASLLKPGAAIFCVAQKKADGSLTAARITAEKDGVKPPM
jgi:hypothetical protein